VQVILIVDSDLGFVFWLGHAIDEGGWEALPAKSVTDALSLIGQLQTAVDLLIVNPSLEGIAGLVEKLLELNPNLKVIALLASGEKPVAGVDACVRKPDRVDESSKLKWQQTIGQLLVRGRAAS